MAKSTDMVPTRTRGALWKGKNKKHVIPQNGPRAQAWLLRQNERQNWPELPQASPALGPFLLIHSPHLPNTDYVPSCRGNEQVPDFAELMNEEYSSNLGLQGEGGVLERPPPPARAVVVRPEE